MMKKKILLEMRPALDGFAGIPQETRLLFRNLRMLDFLEVEGMLQHSGRFLSKGISSKPTGKRGRYEKAKHVNRLSRSIISLREKPYSSKIGEIIDYLQKQVGLFQVRIASYLGFSLRLSLFEPDLFKDFIWRSLFSKTLPSSDFALVTKGRFRILRTPWKVMHRIGLKGSLLTKRYLSLDTQDFDFFVAQTPYPARISKNTTFIVRYHDALPILMPHTIGDKSFHQAAHYHALKSNVRDGAYFACVSQATKDDLVAIFPEAEEKAYVIHNMVSHDYYPEESAVTRVSEIIKSRVAPLPALKGLSTLMRVGKHAEVGANLSYLLVVSTIEPRKNHLRLLEAWEALRADGYPDLKLVVVGSIGWDYDHIIQSFAPWVDRGELHFLSKVPSSDLRILYKHAKATVCPSLGEGFDFSGIEAMRSGGIVVASDIPVHREVYGDVAEYFDPYSTLSTAQAIRRVLGAEFENVRIQRIEKGILFSERYYPESILPKWQSFFQQIENRGSHLK